MKVKTILLSIFVITAINSRAALGTNRNQKIAQVQDIYSESRQIAKKALKRIELNHSLGNMLLPYGRKVLFIDQFLKAYLKLSKNIDDTIINFRTPNQYSKCHLTAITSNSPAAYYDMGQIYFCSIDAIDEQRLFHETRPN